ncbi:hypothetical protein [Prevotella pallens]|jgi:hypothetical protein|uniref:hypothetical protein n=1 Tax=Prevotella pallens TaxID=60133 RepID=UPI0028E99FD0|nr:hypothetical protein [Prevotella pallens]
MKQKNLAEEYATARLQGRLSGNEVSFSGNKVFTEEDIEDAFNAGRDSMVESLPKLKWRRVHKDGPYLAITVFDRFYRIEFVYNEFHLFCNSYFISCYISLSDAKQAAKEHYKKQIKQALGL